MALTLPAPATVARRDHLRLPPGRDRGAPPTPRRQTRDQFDAGGPAGALRIGPLEIDPPVVLAPMAGVTNAAFRRLCRRYGAGLYVSEMVNARGLVEGGGPSWDLAAFDPDESPRSLQLYGTDPAWSARPCAGSSGGTTSTTSTSTSAARPRRSPATAGARRSPPDPGCSPPWSTPRCAAAGTVPVTVKLRMGLDDDRLTHLTAGRLAADAGAAAVALHARTAEQRYSGRARWDAVAELVAALPGTPVLGNGDVWTADDAVAADRAPPGAPASWSAGAASGGPGSSASSPTPSPVARPAPPRCSERSPRSPRSTPACSWARSGSAAACSRCASTSAGT